MYKRCILVSWSLVAATVGLTGCAVPATISAVLDAGQQSVPIVGSAGLGASQPNKLSTSSASVALQSGQEQPLITLLKDADGQLPTQALIWVSSNDTIARINPTTGQIKALTPGQVIVTASLQNDPSVKVALSVTVTASQTVVLIKLMPDSPTVQIGDTLPLTAEVDLADGTINGNVAWSSSDDTIATVNPTTGQVTALREGKVTISGAYTLDPKYKGIAAITIVKDKAALPSATPSSIVFGPGATPLPIVKPPSLPPVVNAPFAPSLTPTPAASPVSAQAEVTFEGYTALADLRNPSNRPDNGDEVLQRGESMFVFPYLRNFGTSNTDNVSVTLASQDDYSKLEFVVPSGAKEGGSLFAENLPSSKNATAAFLSSSAYKVVPKNYKNSSEPARTLVFNDGGYLLSVSTDCPHGHVIRVDGSIADRYGNSWTSSFDVTIP